MPTERVKLYSVCKQDAVTSNPHSFVLFPAIGASTFSTLAESTAKTSSSGPCNTTHNKADITWDIVVLDGTWCVDFNRSFRMTFFVIAVS